MQALLQFLQQVHPLSVALQEHLTEIAQYRAVPKKGILLRAGHHCRHLYFIKKGLLRCYYYRGTTEVSSSFMKENDVIFSAESFYLRQVSYESIQAIEDSELFYISYEQLYHIYRVYPEFNWTGRELSQELHINRTRQLYGLRMQQSPQRYAWLLEHDPELILRVPAKFLASYLGISEVMLSVIKGKKY